MKPVYIFTARIWEYGGQASWFFVSVPKEESDEIKLLSSELDRRGFGSVKVTARIRNTSWETSIFPDKKLEAYILPIKKEIRTKNNLAHDSKVTVELLIRGI